ncbi:MAG TPA: hypothetical protein VE029_05625 [Rhizobacter sp.]|nr:hypothetical protein [Rhizobacter sp.]
MNEEATAVVLGVGHALQATFDRARCTSILTRELACVRVKPGFKLSPASATAWIEDGYRKPG